MLSSSGSRSAFAYFAMNVKRYVNTTKASPQRKVAIVTGSSSGIGQGIAVELSGRGYAVALCGRNQERLEQTKEQCRENGARPEDLLIIAGDLTSAAEPSRIASLTAEKFGRINALINNAGMSRGNMNSYTANTIDKTFDINLKAPMLLTQACFPHLETSKGTIINISSSATALPNIGFIEYGISKAALDHFTLKMACHFAPFQIRVCGVLPGYIPTTILDLTEDQQLKFEEEIIGMQLIKRLSNTGDISKTVVFLLSDDASFITGVNIHVDGGFQHNSIRPLT